MILRKKAFLIKGCLNEFYVEHIKKKIPIVRNAKKNTPALRFYLFFFSFYISVTINSKDRKLGFFLYGY